MLLSLCHVKASGGRELGLLPCCPPSAYQDCLARALAMNDLGAGDQTCPGWGSGSFLPCSQRRKVSVLSTGRDPSARIRMGSLPRKLFMVPE